MRQAGYTTAMVGKLHLTPVGSPDQPGDGDFGFDTIRLTEGPQPGGFRHWLETTAPAEAQKHGHAFPPERLGDVYHPEECLPEELHPTGWVGERAISAWRRRVQHRPAFLHISFPDPRVHGRQLYRNPERLKEVNADA